MGHIRDDQRLVFSHQFDLSVLPIGRVSNGEDRLTEESLKTMSRYRNFTTICCAAVFALGLAACGGGDDGISVADRDAAVAAEQAKTVALQKELDALRTQLGLEDDGNVGDSVADLQAEVMRLEGLVEAEKMAKEAADMKAMTATAKKLKAAIEAGSLAATGMLGPAGLMVDPDGPNATDVPTATLKAGEAGGSMGDWMGMSYANTEDGKILDEAMVYTDRGMATDEKAATVLAGGGYDSATSTVMFSGDSPDPDIAGDSFPTALTKTFDLNGAPSISFSGSYKGVPGTYHCAGSSCTARNDGSDGIALTAGQWTFVHAEGATASEPDGDHLQFGWWVRKGVADGEPTMASAFFGSTGDVDKPTVNYNAAGGGSATYTGMAIGKYAMTETKTNSAEGGHFTADVTLEAKFGATSDANPTGLSGTIDNFMAGDESKPWSVKLSNQEWDVTGSTEDAAGTTVWSINGNAAAASGSWKAQMYDEVPPAKDGSDVPTTAIGSFQSHYGESGRMVGAFGANKQ